MGVVNMENALMAEGVVSAATLVAGAISGNVLMFAGGFGGTAFYNVAEVGRSGWKFLNSQS